jgi:spoIIIJ-associated protein
MSERGQEFSAKSVEEAIEEGLRALGLPRDAVAIEIINRGSRGILGFGSEPAVVRMAPLPTQDDSPAGMAAPTETPVEAGAEATPIETPVAAETADTETADTETADTETADTETADTETAETEAVTAPAVESEALDEAAAFVQEADEAERTDDSRAEGDDTEELEALAVDLLAELLELMGFEAEIVTSWDDSLEEDGEPYLNLDIRGDDLGVLIGRRGETLANLQFLLRLMINQRLKSWKNIVIDVEQYKQRRVAQLTQLANRMAEQVATSDRPVSLEPMPANERRIIHIALREHPAVYTESTGEGDRRKITILPR